MEIKSTSFPDVRKGLIMISKDDIEKLITEMFAYSAAEKIIGMIGDKYHCVKTGQCGSNAQRNDQKC